MVMSAEREDGDQTARKVALCAKERSSCVCMCVYACVYVYAYVYV